MIQKKFKIIRSRKYLPIPSYWNVLAMTNVRISEVYKSYLNSYHHYYTKDGVRVFYPEKEWQKFSRDITQRLVNDSLFFNSLDQKQKRRGLKLYEISNEILKSSQDKSLSQLLNLYQKIRDKWVDYNIYNMPSWLVAVDNLKNVLESKFLSHVPVKKREEFFQPIKESLSFKEEKDFCYLAKKLSSNTKNRSVLLDKYSRQLSEKFGWLPVSYDVNNFWDKDFYKNKFLGILPKGKKFITLRHQELLLASSKRKERFKSVLRVYKINKSVKRLFNIFQKLYIFQDERKHYTFLSHLAWEHTARSIAEKLDVDYLVMKYLTLEEIRDNYSNRNQLKEIFQSRYKKSLLFDGYFNKKVKIIEGVKAKRRFDELVKSDDQYELLSGQVANKTKNRRINGKVKILLSSREVKYFPKNCILVTTMTSPDYIEALRRAKAVITDEGGVTCHAAILSRELKIPSIIGTKKATQILKDGEMISMDLESGYIQKKTL